MPNRHTGSSRDSSKYVSRRTLLRASAGIGAAGLAGCASGGDSDDPQGESVGSPSGGGEAVELDVWHQFTGQLGEVFEDHIDAFNEQADDVTVVTTAHSSYREVYQGTMAAINANQPPHLANVDITHMFPAKDSGLFTPAGEIVGERVDLDQYMNSLINFFEIDGDIMGWPFNNSVPMQFYNVDMFEEAGLDAEDPPTTMAGVREASEALVENTDAQEGTSWPNRFWMDHNWFSLDGQVIVNNANGHEGHPTEIMLHTDTADRIYNWWNDMYHDGLYMNAGVGDYDAAGSAFFSERTGMLLTSSSWLARIQDNADFEVAAAQQFSPHDDRTGAIWGGGGMVCPTDAIESDAERQALGDLLAFLSSPEIQADNHKRTGYLPIHEDARQTLEDEGFFEENPMYSTAIREAEQSEPDPATRLQLVGPADEMNVLLDEMFVRMAGGDPVDQVLEETKVEIDEELQSY